jgi:hypothetical protein
VLGQALTIVTTAFFARLEELWRADESALLERIGRVGFLCSLESLLSTVGNEQRMIRDVRGALNIIKSNFRFRLRLKLPSQRGETVHMVDAGKGVYLIDILLCEECWAWIPEPLKNPDCRISIHTVLFSIGVKYDLPPFAHGMRVSLPSNCCPFCHCG